MDKARPAWFLALVIGYWALADIGVRWAVAPGAGSPIWPSGGLALALMVLAGGRSWLWLAPAVFLGRMLAFATDGVEDPLGFQLAVSTGNMVSVSVGAMLLADRERFDPALHRLRDVLWLMLVAMGSSLVAASVGTASVAAYGTDTPSWPLVLLFWWVGNLGGVLVVTPGLLAWSRGDPLPRGWQPWAHLAAIVVVAGALTWAVFTQAHTFLRTWTIFPVVIWAALALQVRGVSVALITVALLGQIGMAWTPGFLESGEVGDPGFLLIQQFVSMAAVSGLVLAVVADERRGREALARSEARLWRVIDSPLVGVAVGDPEGNLRLVNDVFLQLTGLTRDAVDAGLVRWTEVTPPDWLQVDRLALDEIARHGVAQPYEKEYQRPDGTRVPVRIHVAALPHEPGMLVAFVLDQTEQRSARHALRATVERLAFLNELTDAVRDLPDADAVACTAADRLGQHLAARCTWREGDAPAAWLVRTTLGSRAVEHLRQGMPVVQGAVLAAGLARRGQMRAVILVQAEGERVWTEHEIRLVQDVVERVHAHVERARNVRSLEESEERLRLAQAAAGVGVFEWCENGRLIWSEGLEVLYGLKPGTFEGTREAWERRIAPEDRARVLPALEEAKARRLKSHTAEYRIVRPDGTRRWVASQIRLFYDEQGRPQRLLGVNVDVHERKVAEEALREQEERLRSALAGGKMGAWDWNVREDSVAWDERQYELWGLPGFGGELSEALEAVVPADRVPVREALTAAIARRVPIDAEFRVRREGAVRWLHAMGRPLVDATGAVTRVVGVTFDVTDRKQAEADREVLLEAERSARAEAEALNRLKDEFLATLSHELRTPLHAMLGYAGLLQKPGVSPEMLQKGLAAIDRAARTQARLVEDLLDMSRIVSGKMRLALVPLDPSEAVHAAVDTMRPTADAKAIVLEEDVDRAVGLVSADAHRLQQVTWNLLSNAIKFTPSGGRVRIRLRRKADRMVLVVSDTGTGIPAAFLPHVFERFRQVNGSSTREHGGLGLGLGIVKQLVELQGGEIHAESAGPGRGATFTVELPLLDVDAVASEVRAADEVRLDAIHALVVDDDEEGRELVRRLLEDRGASVRTAASAEEALALVPLARPHVIVSDIGMPGLDGYGMLRRLRALPEEEGGHTPAVALTAYAREPDRELALAAGFQEHVAKPVDAARLSAVVARLADGGLEEV